MPSLARVEKGAVLEAIVEARYDVRVAARALRVSKTTIYRKLRRWNLTPPMFAARVGGRVLRKDFVERCEAIREALKEVNLSKEASKSYVPNRDSTAGRNNDNPQLEQLDRRYESDEAREGTNADRDSFDRDGRC